MWLDFLPYRGQKCLEKHLETCREKKAKSLDLTTEGQKKMSNAFLITQTSTRRGRAVGDYIYVTSGKRGRAAGCVKSREKLCCGRCHPRYPSLCADSGSGCCTHEEGLGRSRGGEWDPSHPPLAQSLRFSFIHWLFLQCLPYL